MLKEESCAHRQDKLGTDISSVPFSRFGSYMAFSRLEGVRHKKTGLPDGIWLRSVHGDGAYEVMRLELINDGMCVPVTDQSTASVLTLRGKNGQVDICLPDPNTVRIRVNNTKLRITAREFRNHGAVQESDGNWVLSLARIFRSYRLIPLSGHLQVDAPWETKRCRYIVAEVSPNAGDSVAEMVIEELTWMRPARKYRESFEDLAQKTQSEFEIFAAPLLSCPEEFQSTATAAAWLNWSSVVHPHGLIKRPAMYMSKNWMTNVWAWDHAFNALSVSLTDPDLAWDQLMVIFDHQNESGQIPDFINDIRYMTNFVKPPIHGWILSRMIMWNGKLTSDRTEKAYRMLAKWTEWWLRFRNPDKDGLPVYWHGNDSGWDNGTVFDETFPIKSPDLAAFLILQMDVLADLATQLDRTQDAESWHQQADSTLEALIRKLWDGSRFRAISIITGAAAEASDSVFGCLPIVLGKRLPEEIRMALVTEIRRHLTKWGLPTEHPESPLYDPAGYWRGPIWAPPTMLIVDGLRAGGQDDLAMDIARRFCRICTKSGFAENFNARTGEALCDPAYTWTSSVFLVLANKYLPS